MTKSPEYLIDHLLPSNEIHLLAGPTGAGKTRWLFQMLMDWQEGLPILGFKSHPVAWDYASADRSTVSAGRTVRGMGIDPKKINFIAAWDRQMTLNQIIGKAEEDKAKFLIIESFGSFVDHPATSNNVKKFMQTTSAIIRQADMTLMGVMEQPKMKPKERYGNPRQRISGVASWGHFAETIILVEPVVNNESSTKRLLHICPRNGAEISRDMEFHSDGRLYYNEK